MAANTPTEPRLTPDDCLKLAAERLGETLDIDLLAQRGYHTQGYDPRSELVEALRPMIGIVLHPESLPGAAVMAELEPVMAAVEEFCGKQHFPMPELPSMRFYHPNGTLNAEALHAKILALCLDLREQAWGTQPLSTWAKRTTGPRAEMPISQRDCLTSARNALTWLLCTANTNTSYQTPQQKEAVEGSLNILGPRIREAVESPHIAITLARFVHAKFRAVMLGLEGESDEQCIQSKAGLTEAVAQHVPAGIRTRCEEVVTDPLEKAIDALLSGKGYEISRG